MLLFLVLLTLNSSREFYFSIIFKSLACNSSVSFFWFCPKLAVCFNWCCRSLSNVAVLWLRSYYFFFFIRADIGIRIAFAAFDFFGVVTIISAVGVFYLLIHWDWTPEASPPAPPRAGVNLMWSKVAYYPSS